MEKNNNKNMNSKNIGGQYGKTTSSSTSSFDYLFGPRYLSSSSSSSTNNDSFLSTIFPPHESALARDQRRNDVGSDKYEKSENFSNGNKGEGSTSKDSKYQNETSEASYYYSSSIHYGGQENYSSTPSTAHESQYNNFRKDGKDDDSNDNNPNSASRGDWWQGSLYY